MKNYRRKQYYNFVYIVHTLFFLVVKKQLPL